MALQTVRYLSLDIIFRSDRPNGKGGGTAVYVKELID